MYKGSILVMMGLLWGGVGGAGLVNQGVEVRHNVSLTAQQLDSLGGPVDWTIEGTVDKTGNDEYAVAWIERKDYRTVTQSDARVRGC
jgi:hypothetical protein